MSDPFALRLRAAAQSALPPGAFLRRDRGDALFVTDAPRRGANPDWTAPGFHCACQGGLARLTPGPDWLSALEDEYPAPPDPFCAAFVRFRGMPGPGALRLFALGMKILDGGPYDPAFDRRLRQTAAETLRNHASGGGLYACALIRYIIERERLT